MASGDATASLVGRRAHRVPRPSARHVLVIVLALVAGVANVALLRGADRSIPVLVADADIAAGTRILSDHLGVADLVATGDLADRFVPGGSADVVVGQVATRPIPAGDPILVGDVVAGGEGARAMSLPVTLDTAVGGALVPGDLVDVIGVSDEGTAYLARGLRVLSVPVDDGLGATDFAPTVAVDADTALVLAAALEAGPVHLVRSTGADG